MSSLTLYMEGLIEREREREREYLKLNPEVEGQSRNELILHSAILWSEHLIESKHVIVCSAENKN